VAHGPLLFKLEGIIAKIPRRPGSVRDARAGSQGKRREAVKHKKSVSKPARTIFITAASFILARFFESGKTVGTITASFYGPSAS
jgi:hypothetical protein